ncbi:acyltransferase domain-containing protein [Jannaschia sp.]|nr:acyltransferase domain-containing protein [Jannaschia sp.]
MIELFRPPPTETSAPRPPVVWMFAGQGAQFFGMGAALMTGHPVFRAWMERLDAELEPFLDRAILSVLYDESARLGDPFDRLSDSHPALFMVQVAMAQTLIAEGVPPPDLILGVSLGEFVGSVVAGAQAPETALRDLLAQAALFEAQTDPGAMLMILDDVARFRDDPIFAGRAELAGTSFARCFVVAGPPRGIAEIAAHLAARDVACQLLPVRFAFHSSAIDPVEAAYRRRPRKLAWTAGRIPVIGATDGTAQPFDPATRDWWRVAREPIRLDETLRALDTAHPGAVYVDLGPAGNLATACRHALPGLGPDRAFGIMGPYGSDLANLDMARRRLAGVGAST